MILEDAQQAVTATQRMFTAVRAGAVTTTELRAALEQTRVLMATGAAFQTAAAELIATRERHGDGGAEVLAVSAGLTQSEAHSQVKTAQVLRKVPKLRDAVQNGQVPQANARRLADVITKTSADAVAGDAELLKQAASLRPEQFGVATRRWITAQQGDNGASEHARQRAKRYLKFYDTDDGMIALHGEFDKITGTRIHNRIRHIAGQFFTNDKKLPKTQRRQFPQCMADALDHTTNTPATNTDSQTSKRNQNSQNAGSVRRVSSESIASSRTQNAQNAGSVRRVRRVNDESNASSSKTCDGQGAVTGCGEDTSTSKQAAHINKVGNAQNVRTGNGQSINTDTTTATDNNSFDSENAGDGKDAVDAVKSKSDSHHDTSNNADADENVADAISTPAPQTINDASAADSDAVCGVDAVDTASNDHGSTVADGEVQGSTAAGWVADITLVAHVDDATGELIAELSDGTRLPDAVLEELSCNTRWTGLIYDRVGDAIWRSRSRRTVSESQWQTLLTIYGGCFHCGAPPRICQAHHIIPYSRGGATSVKNMVMVCWNCHHNIHHNNWHIQTHDDNHHTLHPPTRPSAQSRHGPAHTGEYHGTDYYKTDHDGTAPEPPARRGRSPSRTENKPGRDKKAITPRNPNEPTGRSPTSSTPNSKQKERSLQARNPAPQARDPVAATLW